MPNRENRPGQEALEAGAGFWILMMILTSMKTIGSFSGQNCWPSIDELLQGLLRMQRQRYYEIDAEPSMIRT